MVGDRIFDIEAAQGNGIPFIGCAYGYGQQEIMDADFVAQSPTDVYDGVVSLIGTD